MELPYLAYFHLNEEPFSTSPNPRFLFVSTLHSTALQKTRYVVAARKGLACVFGPTGTGKTTLARLLYQRFVEEDGFVGGLLTNPNYPTPYQLLRTITQELRVPATHKSFKGMLDLLKRHLYQLAIEEGRVVALIIDEAQTLHFPLMEFLRQLLNYETNDQKILQLVLFAQDELRSKLARAPNLQNRVVMSSTLENLTLDDTEAMLRFRWQVAGGQEFPLSPDAIRSIYDYSQGVPRSQVIIADNALLAATLQRRRTIDRELIDNVVADRGLSDMVPAATDAPRQSQRKVAAGGTPR